VRRKYSFLIDEVGLNELRVRMIPLAEFVPSPKMSRPLGEAPLRCVSLALGVGWKLDGVRRLAVGSGFCGMSLRVRLYAVRRSSSLPDRGGRDDELLEYMG
jgi:hypothetical protein